MGPTAIWFWTEDPPEASCFHAGVPINVPVRGALPPQAAGRSVVWRLNSENHLKGLLFTPVHGIFGPLQPRRNTQLIRLGHCGFTDSDLDALDAGFGRHPVAGLVLPMTLPGKAPNHLGCLLLVLRDILRREVEFALVDRGREVTVVLARVQICDQSSGLIGIRSQIAGS